MVFAKMIGNYDEFDCDAVYYQETTDDLIMDDYGYDPDEYDECFANYVDARRGSTNFACREASCLSLHSTPNASGSNQQPINNKGKGKKDRGKGRGGKNNVKYSKPPMKPHDPKGRAQAALRCLRCGSTSHTTAQCTQGSKPIQKATVEKAPCTDLRSDPTLLQNSYRTTQADAYVNHAHQTQAQSVNSQT